MIFEVKNGCFGYKNGRDILKNVSFTVSEGQILSVLGPNGVGKTTLLRCMMGLLYWRSGGSYINGRDIRAIPSRQLWQKMAYVPQAKSVTFAFTVQEMVLLGRSAHIGMMRQPSVEDESMCEQAMHDVGICHLRDKYCNQISGGELQMALIARALCAKPALLILDEPESNLDFRNQLIILDTIAKLAREQNISCIFNTHYPAHALKVSNKSLILSRDGRSLYGDSGTVINNAEMRRVFDVNVHINHVVDEAYDYHTVTALSIV